jgi:YbbR domain-containing protein
VEEVSKAMRSFFSSGIVIKIISLLFATLLWFFVVAEEKSELTLPILVELVNVPKGLMVLNEIPTTINVRFYGARSQIRELSVQRLSYVVDLKNVNSGTITINITPDAIATPANVKIIRIQPNQFDIELGQIEKRMVPVSPNIVGSPAKDYEIDGIDIDPPRVEIIGSREHLERVKTIRTQPVVVEGATKDVMEKVGLELNSLKRVNANLSEGITVKVRIKPVIGRRKLQNIPVSLDAPNEKIKLWPSEVTVTVEGPAYKIRELSPDDIRVLIPQHAVESRQKAIAPQIILPDDVHLIEIRPMEINTVLKRKS